MASFSRSAINAFGAGYNAASPREDKDGKTAYQRYVEKFYGPDVTSHRDPIALARAASGAVERGLKTGAGFLSHAAAGLLGAPQGPSRATPQASGGGIGSDVGAASRDIPSNRLYGNSAVSAGLGSAGGSGSGYGNFNDVGSRISNDLQRDFGLSANQAAGIVGNLGHESGGFTKYQEVNPTSGRGGAGWAQWTGSRRTDFENYTKQNNLHPQSYEANYGFLKKELTGPYKGAIAAVKKANTVQDAVYAFEGTYEKAGKNTKGYGSRLKYANSIVAGAPTTALAYTSTGAKLTPAQQAAAAEAAGQPSSLGSISRRGDDVAAMQRDLNSRGAKLTVDGLEGPLTRQAAQQFYGSPTSVRTPSFTNPPATTANNWSSLQGSPTSTVNQRQDYVSTPGFTNRQSYTSGRGDEGSIPRAGVASTPSTNQPYTPAAATPQTPYYNNPYTGSTGGSINPNIRTVQAVPIQSDVAHKSPLPGYYDDQTASGMTIQGGRPVPTRGGYAPTTAPVLAGGFSRAPVPQTPSFMDPYTMSTGGANAIVQPTQTARLPRARPDYQPPQQAVPTAGMSLGDLQALAEKYGVPVGHIADVASDIGSRASSAVREGMSRNAGNNYSGGNYQGGSYGGAAGRSINTGVGGAFKNR